MSPLVPFVLAVVARATSSEELTSCYFVQHVAWELADSARTLSLEALAACPRLRAEATSRGLLLSPSAAGLDAAASIELPAHAGPAFRDALVSWNAIVPDHAGLIVELRVARNEGSWSPWLQLGDWGERAPATPVVSFDGGRVEVDVFRSESAWDRAQVRVRAWRADSSPSTAITLERVSLCVSDRTTPHLVAWERFRPSRGCTEPAPRAPLAPGRIDVPFRSQRALPPELAPRCCSPTSLAMVLAFRGVERTTEEVAALVYDRAHDLYGNWTRAIQGAFTLGVRGYAARFSSWVDVEESIRANQPLVISIAAAEGELHGAPYAKTDGHLLVLCGFDAQHRVLVNDPAAVDAAHGQLAYSRADLERCWFGHGGVAYVLEPPASGTSSR